MRFITALLAVIALLGLHAFAAPVPLSCPPGFYPVIDNSGGGRDYCVGPATDAVEKRSIFKGAAKVFNKIKGAVTGKKMPADEAKWRKAAKADYDKWSKVIADRKKANGQPA